jgi:DNA adenine methylase
VGRFEYIQPFISGWQIEHLDAIECIKKYDRVGTMIYIDPPYPLSTRNDGLYTHEMSDQWHQNLLDVVTSAKSMILLSSYDNDMYNTVLSEKSWTRESFQVFTKLKGHVNESGRGANAMKNKDHGYHRTEVLWANPACIHARVDGFIDSLTEYHG